MGNDSSKAKSLQIVRVGSGGEISSTKISPRDSSGKLKSSSIKLHDGSLVAWNEIPSHFVALHAATTNPQSKALSSSPADQSPAAAKKQRKEKNLILDYQTCLKVMLNQLQQFFKDNKTRPSIMSMPQEVLGMWLHSPSMTQM